MKAIVCGAGIAGLTTATCLARTGWDVVVLEHAPALRDQGYMIDFAGPGYDAAERMGLLPALERARYRIEAIRWLDEDGGTALVTRYERFERILGGRFMSLQRGDIEHALHDAMPPSVEMRFNRTVEAMHDEGGHVTVDMGDGLVEKADLLVGAGGVHSRVRALAFGPEDHFLRDLGFRTSAFIFEDAELFRELGNEVRLLAMPDRQAAFYPLRDNRVTSFLAHRGDEALPPDPVKALHEHYDSMGWVLPRAIEAASRLPSVYYDVVAQVVMPRWSKGRVVLVGDAAQAVSLLAAQGASIAMAAGEALARSLAGAPGVEAGLERYEASLRKLVARTQASGRRMANWVVPGSRARIRLRNLFLRAVEMPVFDFLARRALLRP
ncbi:MAG TPA: FAD-dependent monooxygenase [Usitatibacter sp.]|nr:FAD-dependent monooxygenase [Usitatibacter sp.]